MGLRIDDFKKKMEEKHSGSSQFYKLQEGQTHQIRLLPRSTAFFTDKGDDDFAYDYRIHFKIFDVKGYKRLICKRSIGEKCPICEYAFGMKGDPKAKKLFPTTTYLFNIYDYKSKKIMVLDTRPSIHDQIVKILTNPRYQDSILQIKNGRDITIEKGTITPGKPNPDLYSVMAVPDRTDVVDQLPEDWETQINNLADLVPSIEEDAVYLTVVDCLRSGKLPEPREIKKEKEVEEEAETVSEAKPAETKGEVKKEESGKGTDAPATVEKKVEETVSGEKLKCWGVDFAPRTKDCQACSLKVTCRDKVFAS